MNMLDSLISVIIGGCCVAFINYMANEKRLSFERERMIFESNERKKARVNEIVSQDKEVIIEKLLEIKALNSLTMNYIMERIEISEKDIHEKYLEQVKTIRRILVKARINFQEIVEDLNELNVLCNMSWGKQQSYFGYAKDDKKIKNILRLELIENFDKVTNLCSVILQKLW